MKIRPVGAVLIHAGKQADKRTARHDKTYANALKHTLHPGQQLELKTQCH
jgi:hypothetical protein